MALTSEPGFETDLAVLIRARTPDDLALLLADLTWLYGNRFQVAAKGGGTGGRSLMATADVLPEGEPADTWSYA